jgi:hypothetical protein
VFGAARVDGARDEFLPGSCLAGDQDRASRRRDAVDALDDIAQRSAAADDAIPFDVRADRGG